MIPIGGQTFGGLVNGIITFANQSLIPLLFALAFLFFIAGVARYFFSQNDENRQKGREFAIWGLVGLAVIFGLWGIVNIFLALLQG